MESVIIESLQDYGWYILGGAVIVAFIWSKLQPSVRRLLQKHEEKAYAARYHKDPDLLMQRFAAQQRHIDKLQTQYEQDVEVFKEKQEKKEAMKREEILKKTDNQGGYVLGHGTSSSKTSGYNPLMGDNTRSYRPVRKSPCSGGGCGR